MGVLANIGRSQHHWTDANRQRRRRQHTTENKTKQNQKRACDLDELRNSFRRRTHFVTIKRLCASEAQMRD
jgi:hypothetical protein